jgi:Domain of unknown function (DUF4407)
VLTFPRSPAALNTELAQKKSAAAALQPTVDADEKEVSRLTDLARKECAGTAGEGLTGDRGYGPDCIERNNDIVVYRSAHQVEQNGQVLAQLRADIAGLTASIKDANTDFESDRNELIDTRLDQARADQPIPGLLERIKALHALASSEVALFFATWAVRLFLILVDCLPVVIKFSGGNSQYDQIVKSEGTSAVRHHIEDLTILANEDAARTSLHKADLERELSEELANLAMQESAAVSRVLDHSHGHVRPRGGD